MSQANQTELGFIPSDTSHFQLAQAAATKAFQGELQKWPALRDEMAPVSPPLASEDQGYINHSSGEHSGSAGHHPSKWHHPSHHPLYHSSEHSDNVSQHSGHSGFYSHTHSEESAQGHLDVPQLHNYHPWQSAYQLPQQVGTDLPGRIVCTVGANEGALTKVSRNDNGHGISVGIRQWNQCSGELPDLFKALHASDPEKFNGIFGRYARNLGRESWVRNSDLSGNHDFLCKLEIALHDPEFQKVQINLARDFAQKSIETAREYGLKTEQGAALVADITNQLGEGGARRIFAEAGLRSGGFVHNEMLTLQRMEHFTHRPNSRGRFNVIVDNFHSGALIQPPLMGHDSAYMA